MIKTRSWQRSSRQERTRAKEEVRPSGSLTARETQVEVVVPTVQPVRGDGMGPIKSPEDDLRRQAARLYREGMTLSEVGEALGCSLPKARRMVQDSGVEIRPPGGGRRSRQPKTKGLEKLPGITWLPAEDSFMTQERRRMLRYLVEGKGLGWSECRSALRIDADVLERDLSALGLTLERTEEAQPEATVRTVEVKPARRRGRRLKNAEHLVEDVSTMRSLRDQGTPIEQIASLFGLSVVTVNRRLAMTDEDIRVELSAAADEADAEADESVREHCA